MPILAPPALQVQICPPTHLTRRPQRERSVWGYWTVGVQRVGDLLSLPRRGMRATGTNLRFSVTGGDLYLVKRVGSMRRLLTAYKIQYPTVQYPHTFR